jgi:hypothetical protein
MKLHINSRGKLVEDTVYRGILNQLVNAMKAQIIMDVDNEILEMFRIQSESGNKEE